MLQLSWCLLSLDRLFRKSLIASKIKVAHCDLVVAVFREDAFAIVENLYSKVFGCHTFDGIQFLVALQQFDVDRCTRVVRRANQDFLLEDDSVLGGHVGVHILERFTLNNLCEGK